MYRGKNRGLGSETDKGVSKIRKKFDLYGKDNFRREGWTRCTTFGRDVFLCL